MISDLTSKFLFFHLQRFAYHILKELDQTKTALIQVFFKTNIINHAKGSHRREKSSHFFLF
jgi:hypothetical protein